MWPPLHPGARLHVDEGVGSLDRLFVMLDDDDRLTDVAKALQGCEESGVVTRVQPDGRLVEDVEHAGEARCDLRRESDPLHLAARQGAADARQVSVTASAIIRAIMESSRLATQARLASACYLTGKRSMTVNSQIYNLACVWFDSNSLGTAFAAHEISHALGLDHSFDNTNNICATSKGWEYYDPGDIARVMVTYPFTDNNWLIGGGNSSAGPGMNAPNLLRLGWLPTANQRKFELDGGELSFTISALSHPRAQQPMVVLVNIGLGGAEVAKLHP